MADIKSPANPLFLREEDLRQGIELLFYAYRDFTTEADAMLLQYGFGRAHHRVIYFVGRNPGMPVAALLDILNITKQSLSRVLGQLVRQGFITQRPGPRDRRQRLLELTRAGRRAGAPPDRGAARARRPRLPRRRRRRRRRLPQGPARPHQGPGPHEVPTPGGERAASSE